MKVIIGKDEFFEQEIEVEDGKIIKATFTNGWTFNGVLSGMGFKNSVVDVSDIDPILWNGIVKENEWMEDMNKVFTYENFIIKLTDGKFLVYLTPNESFVKRGLIDEEEVVLTLTPFAEVLKEEDEEFQSIVYDVDRCYK